MYKFKHDWFSNNIENLSKIFSHYRSAIPPNILEIGAFEGRSTVWFLENVSDCSVTTIDTWAGGNDHDPNNTEISFIDAESNFYHNIGYYRDRVAVFKDTSYNALTNLINSNKTFDFVYVDGSHTAIDVNLDLILSFKLLNLGGILYVDDYFWGFNDQSIYNSPKLGVDSFVNVYANKLTSVEFLQNNAAVYIKAAG
jgi:predicted O-methyltransferase YrrM